MRTYPTVTTAPTAETAAWVLHDPNLPPTELAAIAAWYPGLHLAVANHPNAYPQLLDWLCAQGNVEVCQAVAVRRQRAEAPRRLRKDMTKLIGVYIGAIAIMQIIGPIVMVFGMLLDPSFWEGMTSGDVFQSTQSMTSAYGGWMSLIAIGAASMYFILRGRRLITTDITTTIPVGHRWRLLAVAVLGVLAAQGISNIMTVTLSQIGLDFSAQNSTVNPLTSSIGGLVYICLAGPVVEEVVFRGGILRQLAPYGANFAIVTQALLFSLYHLNWYQGIFTFFLGLVLGHVALRFSLKWSIALHILNNAIAVLTMTSPTATTVLVIVSWVALVGFLILVWQARTPSAVPETSDVRSEGSFLARSPVASTAVETRTSSVRTSARTRLIAGGKSAILAHPFKSGWSEPLFLAVIIIMFLGSGLVTLGMMALPT